ncbi:MAG: hypothetical protein IT564_12650 [Rhodospirillales bacterium]|nr:hypothetical protein [Rhodospirillales bacterium]
MGQLVEFLCRFTTTGVRCRRTPSGVAQVNGRPRLICDRHAREFGLSVVTVAVS